MILIADSGGTKTDWMLLHSKGLRKGEIIATDKEDIPAWAEDGIRTLVNIGAMKGYEDQSFKPLNPLTKAEAAKILYSAM